jgi:hypothetical protein
VFTASKTLSPFAKPGLQLHPQSVPQAVSIPKNFFLIVNYNRLIILMRRYSILLAIFLSGLCQNLVAQNVGVGTTSPNSSAALEIKSSDKGILFPRLTSAQRNAINNPAHGLHLFNLNENCLNYYDSLFQIWNCYCEYDTCKVLTFRISANMCGINFYNAYAVNFPSVKKIAVIIDAGVTISGCSQYAIDFSTIPYNVTVNLINKGSILGAGGSGGMGATGQPGSCLRNANPGNPGWAAIVTRAGVPIIVSNYGTIAGGGGGGGGGGRNVAGEYGGGGGGGAGVMGGIAGNGGGTTSMIITSCVTMGSVAQPGTAGQPTTGGSGGAGANGGGNGGNGGGPAQSGQNGTGSGAGAGGSPGKAINGGSGNSIINIAGGISFGLVD